MQACKYDDVKLSVLLMGLNPSRTAYVPLPSVPANSTFPHPHLCSIVNTCCAWVQKTGLGHTAIEETKAAIFRAPEGFRTNI
jgi:hypothetical protein